MNHYEVDLTNCDKEPIHIPGKVQSHGFLIAVNSTSLLVTYISLNIAKFINDEAKNWLGKPIEDLERKLHITGAQLTLAQVVKMGGNDNRSYENVNSFYLEMNGKPYNLLAAISGSNHILEFETITSDLDFDVQKTIGRSVSEILTGKNLSSLLANAAIEVKKIINYDRVMIYKFGEDGHGEVVAETKNDELEPFLGLHYPATDIPKQARELYKLNLTRIIADVNEESSPIITMEEDVPLDLTHSALRAVSPIHIQYLKNMGVESSFSISLIAHGELWGLIACHNYSPRFINFKARDASKLIGQILSSALEYRQDEEDIEKSNKLNNAAIELASFLDKDNYIADALARNNVTVQDITSANGVAVVFDGRVTLLGVTPTEAQIGDIIKWLKANMQDSIYYTHRFPETYIPAQQFSDVASGILACIISKELNEIVIWFKPEQVETIHWAGNPEKPMERNVDGVMQLSPRKSFESWSEIVKNTSERWSNEDIARVIKLREQILHAINRKANEIRLLNERLNLAYEELDTFSFTISHDLRTPLSSIKSYSELLLSTNKSLDDGAKRILQRIISGTDKMNFLIKEILNYSRVGRADIEVSPIDMKVLINDVVREVKIALKADDLEMTIGDTPNILGDSVMITQVFTNLINNAVKYSSRSKPPKVKIDGKVTGDEIVYAISDNGVGIDVNYYSRVFELFKRMDNVQEFDGTGVGLAIVKRIVEKHKARIWFESTLGVGTVFYISFKN